jgi:uncharacterized YccA/Bax inhibitor family protein
MYLPLEISMTLYIPALIVTFILALIIIFAKKTAPFLSPVYAIIE